MASAVENKDVKEGKCLHHKTGTLNSQSYCLGCGESVVAYYQEDRSCQLETSGIKPPKSIRKELDSLPISDPVKDLADSIYSEKVGNNTYRSKVRQEVKFTCLYEAFQRLGIVKDPSEIAKMLNIRRKGMSRGILRCSYLSAGKDLTGATKPATVDITPTHLVSQMLVKCNIGYDESHLEDIKRIYEYTKDRSELLNRSKPQSIAAALVYFYLKKLLPDSKINKNEVSKHCDVSSMTITKLNAELESITQDL